MHYEDYAQAVKYLKLALPQMNRHKIPVTPQNYAVWYEFSSGRNPALVAEIGTLLSAQKNFTPTINDHLYEQFITKGNPASIQQLNSGVRSVINSLIAQIQNEQSELNSYTSSLRQLSQEVESMSDLTDVEALIERLIADSHARAAEAELFKQQVNSMSEEVKQLDQQLKCISLDANTDELTGIFNRRAFNHKLEQLFSKSQADQAPLSLIMIDIDHFKRINDSFGHLTGDKVLKFVASLIGKNIRGGDYLARFGGEEFVVILADTTLDNALCVANNIRTYLARQKLYDSTEKLQLGRLTLSMGVSTLDHHEYTEEAPEKLIDRADRCLYLAKSSGRNKAIGQRQLCAEKLSAI